MSPTPRGSERQKHRLGESRLCRKLNSNTNKNVGIVTHLYIDLVNSSFYQALLLEELFLLLGSLRCNLLKLEMIITLAAFELSCSKAEIHNYPFLVLGNILGGHSHNVSELKDINTSATELR